MKISCILPSVLATTLPYFTFGSHEKKGKNKTKAKQQTRASSLKCQKYSLEKPENPCQFRKGQATVTTSVLQIFFYLGLSLFSFFFPCPSSRQYKKDLS